MFAPMVPPALVQERPAPPPGFTLPASLAWKPGTLEWWPFDEERFEVKGGPGKGPLHVTVEGRVWRFQLVASEGRAGILTLTERLKAALAVDGWIWQAEERGVARRDREGRELWLRFAPAGSGELRVVLVERREPRLLELPRPGKEIERPKAQEDFPYLPPWPGARLVRSADTPNVVPVTRAEGKAELVAVNFIEKEYELAMPVSPHEFLTVYEQALRRAGWEIEGRFRGNLVQIQALYTQGGRDLRATLRLLGEAMAISVADVGAQVPASPTSALVKP